MEANVTERPDTVPVTPKLISSHQMYPFRPTTIPPSTYSPFTAYSPPKTITSTSGSDTQDPYQFEATISAPCAFGSTVFLGVMDNLLHNPNITSSHLFRGDIFWDSEKDASFDATSISMVGSSGTQPLMSKFLQHMKEELKPRAVGVVGWDLTRCVVRRLVPRNTKLDRDLVQTCCYFRRKGSVMATKVGEEKSMDLNDESSEGEVEAEKQANGESNLVIYMPHVDTAEEIPWYHPKVKALAFLHSCRKSSTNDTSNHTSLTTNPPPPNSGTLSIHILRYLPSANLPTPLPPDPRLLRTLLQLITILHSHGHGRLVGYKKRVHHDQIVPQPRLQDTYTRLKNKYAKQLLNEYWQEVTDATKGVFEDLGIAAFLMELWRDMYDVGNIGREGVIHEEDVEVGEVEGRRHLPVDDDDDAYESAHTASPNSKNNTSLGTEKPSFPGFVDLACGNGVLTYILLSEGYRGWGFDARSRKTWSAFPDEIRLNLHEMVLMPFVLTDPNDSTASPIPSSTTATIAPSTANIAIASHTGVFPKGTFLISNHADELTSWTPLLAFYSSCPFMAIPCCSHDLSGARFRAPASAVKNEEARKQKQQQTHGVDTERHAQHPVAAAKDEREASKVTSQNAKPPPVPSAYATLCAYIAKLSHSVGFDPEKEILRIPSTRNTAILGRTRHRLPRPHTTTATTENLNGVLHVHEAMPATATKTKLDEDETKRRILIDLVEREMGKEVQVVGAEWRRRVEGILQSKGRNH